MVTSERHLECLKRAESEINDAIAAANATTMDIVVTSMKQAWATLGEITGTSATEDVIDRIYSKFCLGK